MDLIQKITAKNIIAYQQKLNDDLELSPATIKRRLSSIRKFSQWATKQGYLQENPFIKISDKDKGPADEKTKTASGQYQSLVSKEKGIISKAYKAYHQLPGTKYFHYAILIIFCAALGFGIYDQFFKKAPSPFAYSDTLNRPNRYLSFQGRLTDSSNNPISSATNIEFKLWKLVSGGTEGTCTGDTGEDCLWQSNNCVVTPDQDGIFSIMLGTTSGPGYTCDTALEINEDVFTKNQDVWLGITVDEDDEMDPRIQIATVGYALNAETLQGMPPGTDINNIAYINNEGDVVIAAASPSIQGTSGTFAIEGQTGVTIQAGTGVGGNITIAPKGDTGLINLTSEALSGNLLNNQSGASFGTVGDKEGNNLYYGYAGTDSTNLNLLKLESGSTPTARFTVDAEGNASASGILKAMTTGSYLTGDITVSGGDITGANSVNLDIGEASADYITSSVGFAVGGSNTYYINSSGTANLNALTLAGDLTAKANATISGTLSLGPQTQAYAGNCDAFSAGKMYYDGDEDKYYFCNGTEWTEMGAGATSYWSLTGNSLYSTSTDYNLGIGTTEPDAKLHVVGGDIFIAPDTGYTFDNPSGNEDLYVYGNLEVDGTIYGDLSGNFNPNLTNGSVIFQGPTGLSSDTSNFFWDDSNNFLGLGTSTPSSELDIVGTAQMTGFKLTTGASDGFFLVSDANGVGTWTDDSSLSPWSLISDDLYPDSTNYNVGIGNTSPQAKLDVTGDATISGTLSLGPQTQAYAGNCDAFSAGKMYYDGDEDKYYFCNGTEWTEMGAGAASYWSLNNNSLYPISTDYNLGIGTTEPAAKLHVVGTTILGNNLTGSEDALLVNTGMGFTGNLLKLAVNSVQKFAIDSTGQLITGSGTFLSTVADSDSAIAYNFDTLIALTGSGAKLLSIKNAGDEKMSLDKDGLLTLYNSEAVISNSLGDITIDSASGNISFATDSLINVGGLSMGGTASISGTPNLTFIPTSGMAKLYVLNDGDLGFYTSVGGDTGVSEKIRISSSGFLGIGTTNPNTHLDIAGNATISGTLSLAPQVQAYAGTCNTSIAGKMYYDAGENKYYYCNGTVWTQIGSGSGGGGDIYNSISVTETADQIAAFAGDCPIGWEEYTGAQGRTIVGVGVGGSVGGTVGIGMTNLESRSHTHTYTDSTLASNSGASYVGLPQSNDSILGRVQGMAASNGTGNVALYTRTLTTSETSDTMPYVQLRWCKKVGGSSGLEDYSLWYDEGDFLYTVNNKPVSIGSSAPGDIGSSQLYVAGNAVFNSGNVFTDSDNYIHAARFVDTANSQYFLDPAASGTAAAFNGNVGIGTTNPRTKLDVQGAFSGLNVGATSGAATETVTVSTAGTSYNLVKSTGTTDTSTTSTFNITGLPDADGATANIYVQVSKGITGSARQQTLITQINGTQIGSIATSSQTAASTAEETYTVFRSSGTWRRIGTKTVTKRSTSTACSWSAQCWSTSNRPTCYPYEKMTGGGADAGSGGLDCIQLGISAPYDASSWYAEARAESCTGAYNLVTWVFCMSDQTTGSDLAEWYQTTERYLEEGEVVSLDPERSAHILRSQKSYDEKVIGIVPTQPGLVMGNEVSGSSSQLVALSGRVPTKVTLEGGPIQAGDYLVSSSTPGYAMKANLPGKTIGQALEPFDGSQGQTGRVMTFVSIDHYDPDIWLTDSGELNIFSNQEKQEVKTEYVLKNKFNQAVKRIGAFAEVAVAEIKAGLIKTQELIAEKRINSPLIETEVINTQRINLAEIQSSSIDGNININLEKENGFGTLIIEGNASVTGTLSVEEIETEKLKAQDATVSGILYAEDIITKEGRFSDLLNTTPAPTYITQNITNIYQTATPSAETLPDNQEIVDEEEIEEEIINDDFLTDESINTEDDYSQESSSSGLLSDEEINALIDEILATSPEIAAQADLAENIEISPTGDLLAIDYQALNANTLNIANNLKMDSNSLNAINGPLYLQNLGLGGIDLLAGKIVIDQYGNAIFEENVTIKGKLAVNNLAPTENDLSVNLARTNTDIGSTNPNDFGHLLVKGLNNEVVASIDASGSAQFTSLGIKADYSATQSSTIIAAFDNWQENGEYSPAIKTNATAGMGVLPTYEKEIIIYNNKITDKSLIYITPLTDTNNKVIFVKAKKAEKPASIDENGEYLPGEKGWFKVSIDLPINKEIKFNWWIVN